MGGNAHEVDAGELALFPDRYRGEDVETAGSLTHEGVTYWPRAGFNDARTYDLTPPERDDLSITALEPDPDDAPVAEAILEEDVDEPIYATVTGRLRRTEDTRDAGYGGSSKRRKKTYVLLIEDIDFDQELVYGMEEDRQ